jgi:DNA-binding SARP family transcriptional activator/tetratricopeptide (TPR) repeat protein
MALEFRILGPLDALIDGRRIDVSGNRQQIVLACLVLEAGAVVSIDRLMRAVYGDGLPSSARVQVQICVSNLRRLFSRYGQSEAIVTRAQGYVLQLPDMSVDLHHYERLVREGRLAGSAGRREEATARYREALALWRGSVLEGLDSEPLRMAADRLAEERLTVIEDCIEYDLELGRHRKVVAELGGLVSTYPLRERLRGQLMVALYRSGRQAEALDAYRVARRTLIDELGLEPSEWLQQLERSILASDSDLNGPESPVIALPAAPPDRAVPALDMVGPEPGREPLQAVPDPGPAGRQGGPVPCMLPTDIADFTGRDEQIDMIQAHLTAAADDPRQLAVPIIVLAGKPGIGKTALGVHVSHRLVSRYPDGQLFADLHGSTDQISPMRLLERFLRTLGVPGNSIPDGLEERAEMYRGLLSDRRMLVVLDNAGSETQVLPLLPGNPRTAVLITTRSRLGALAGAVHVDVDVLDPAHCAELLSRIAGDDRVSVETHAVEALIELCGRLPLALRIAGARLSARPHWSVEQLAERLENETRRLDELNHGVMGVRVSISLTYDNISDPARRLFRLLAVVDTPIFSAWVCAALLDRPLADAHDLLDDLVDAQLVDIDGVGPSRQYRFHELIRVFARERLAHEEQLAERAAALRRVFGGLLFLAGEAHRKLYGEGNKDLHSAAARWRMPQRVVDRMLSDPLDWFERERQFIVSAVRQAAELGAVEYCWDLAVTSVTLFESRVYLADWRETHEVALAAVRQADDRLGRAVVLYSVGALAIVEKRLVEAWRRLENALELFETLGEEHGQAMANRQLAFLERLDGNLDQAARRYEQVLSVVRRDGNPAAIAYVLHNIAQIELERGNPRDAKTMLGQALELSRQVGGRRIEAQALHRLGQAHLQAGEPEDAVVIFKQALAATRDSGDAIGEAYATLGLGTAYLHAGDLAEAGGVLTAARRLAVASAETMVEARVEFCMGELALAGGMTDAAIAHLERALRIFREIRAPHFEERVLVMLGRLDGRRRVA